MLVDPACTFPATGDATNAVILLRAGITDRQRGDLDAALRADPTARAVHFENSQEAYARFARLYADAPDLVASVKADQLPESYRVELAGPRDYAGFRARFGAAGGVEEIIGCTCPPGLGKGAGR